MGGDPVQVYLAGADQGFLNPFKGDLIKGDAFVVFDSEHLLDMPADAFTLSVRVGCQIDFTSLFRSRFNGAYGLGAFIQNLVNRCVIFAYPGGDHAVVLTFGRKIADMATTGNHLPVFARAQLLHHWLELFQLAGCLDDQQLHGVIPL